MTPLWTAAELQEATGGRLQNCDPDTPISSVSIDSRTLEKGAVFFAITGVSMDGHQFVEKALEAGAALCVVEAEKLSTLPENGSYLVVEDALEAMRNAASASRARMGGKVVGVTGSVGKTSTKEMLRHAFTPSGKTHAPDKSFNNHWGVPLTACRMARDTEFGVFEIGMSAPNEITPLTTLVKPDIAIITTVAPVHLEFFKNVEGIADAKAEIFDGLSQEGAAILNRDNAYYERLLARALAKTDRVYTFGSHEKADARLIDLKSDANGNEITAEILGETIRFYLALPGGHQVMNALAVLLAVKLAGADFAKAIEALGRITATEGRGARQSLKSPEGMVITLIDESYNANPASMRAALAVLEATPPEDGGRRIAVLGDMLELGADGPQLHSELAPVIVERHVNKVFACGPLMKNLFDALPKELQASYAKEAQELAPLLLPQLKHGDVVMVKGSNGVRMVKVLDQLKQNFTA